MTGSIYDIAWEEFASAPVSWEFSFGICLGPCFELLVSLCFGVVF